MLTGKTPFLPEMVLTSYDNLEFAIRIVVSALLGILVGIERSRRMKGAGTRTHCIVAMTAAVFMILSKYAFMDLKAGEAIGIRGVDGARIAAQVVSGISFLGAGIIFKQGKYSVHGLTTAAGMWATAAIGMSIGAGMYWIGITETFVLILMQTILHRFQFGNDSMVDQMLELKIKGDVDPASFFPKLLKEHNCIVDKCTYVRDGEVTTLTAAVRLKKPFSVTEVLQYAKDHPEVIDVQLKDV